MKYYRFVNWKPAEIEKVLLSTIPQALKAYDEGNKEPLKALHIAIGRPWADIGGWRFPYDEYLRKFWVKTKYYGIIEVFALNKTDIRKAYTGIIKIVEVE